jgi:hypothetical protein
MAGMPFNTEYKIAAREFINKVKEKTVCSKCGKQPVEFHNEEHEQDSNRRVAHLVALGFPISRIQAEIDICQALCRSCHMKEDGRLKELQSRCPNKKGAVITQPKPCEICNKISKPLWKNKCRSCYDRIRRAKY